MPITCDTKTTKWIFWVRETKGFSIQEMPSCLFSKPCAPLHYSDPRPFSDSPQASLDPAPSTTRGGVMRKGMKVLLSSGYSCGWRRVYNHNLMYIFVITL